MLFLIEFHESYRRFERAAKIGFQNFREYFDRILQRHDFVYIGNLSDFVRGENSFTGLDLIISRRLLMHADCRPKLDQCCGPWTIRLVHDVDIPIIIRIVHIRAFIFVSTNVCEGKYIKEVDGPHSKLVFSSLLNDQFPSWSLQIPCSIY